MEVALSALGQDVWKKKKVGTSRRSIARKKKKKKGEKTKEGWGKSTGAGNLPTDKLTQTVMSLSHVAARCTKASGLPFALSAGDFPMASKWRHPFVRRCAVQLVPTMFFTSTWFFAWNPPAASVPEPPHDLHDVAPVPPQPLHAAFVFVVVCFFADVAPSLASALGPPFLSDDDAGDGTEMRGACAEAAVSSTAIFTSPRCVSLVNEPSPTVTAACSSSPSLALTAHHLVGLRHGRARIVVVVVAVVIVSAREGENVGVLTIGFDRHVIDVAFRGQVVTAAW